MYGDDILINASEENIKHVNMLCFQDLVLGV